MELEIFNLNDDVVVTSDLNIINFLKKNVKTRFKKKSS
jgi:hypothetical protein